MIVHCGQGKTKWTQCTINGFTQSNRLLAVVGPVGSGKVCCLVVDYLLINPHDNHNASMNLKCSQ